jgi:hypothetical protein
VIRSAWGSEEPVIFMPNGSKGHIAALDNSILNVSFLVSRRSKFLD